MTRTRFRISYVFDISQTEGKELPTLMVDELRGSVDSYPLLVEAMERISPVPVERKKLRGGPKGYYEQGVGRIVLKEGMDEPQTLKTLIHEIAHARLHNSLGDPKNDLPLLQQREVEAESIAYTVLNRFGIDTSDYSFGYIAGWSSDRSVPELRASLETIREASRDLIDELEETVQELSCERSQALACQFGGKGFLEMHLRDEGIDYSVYDREYHLLDGGVIETGANQSLSDVFSAIASQDIFAGEPRFLLDHDRFLERLEQVREESREPSLKEQLRQPVPEAPKRSRSTKKEKTSSKTEPAPEK